jgi:DNA-binding NarL/FixJ family response regulator
MVTTSIRVLCVDDHRVVQEGIGSMLARQGDIEVVASAGSGEQGVALFLAHRPDITLMDLQLPDISGIEAIRRIRANSPDAKVIVLTVLSSDEDIYRALEAGAITYLIKNALSDDLVPTVRDVHAGRHPISAEVSAVLATRRPELALTPREAEVVDLIVKGMRNKEIGATLGISTETVKVHVKKILAKLEVNDRSAVVAAALRRGIIHFP